MASDLRKLSEAKWADTPGMPAYVRAATECYNAYRSGQLVETGEIDAAKAEAEMPATVVSFIYTNWRGETTIRRVVPIVFFWGATEHHPEEQWIIRSLDLDKNAARDFALKDCDFRTLAAPSPR